MPIYEYDCRACGKRHQAIQKMNDEPLQQCPNCSHPELQRVISASAFALKGTGWYVTDFSGKKTTTVVDNNSASETKPVATETVSVPASSTTASE